MVGFRSDLFFLLAFLFFELYHERHSIQAPHVSPIADGDGLADMTSDMMVSFLPPLPSLFSQDAHRHPFLV